MRDIRPGGDVWNCNEETDNYGHQTFTWCPRINAEADINFRRKAKFTDGYEQVSGDELNLKASNGQQFSPVMKPTFPP